METTKLKGTLEVNVIAQIPDVEKRFEINTPLRLSHFLAQAAHESGNFEKVYENLNYGAKGLLGIFPKYFNAELANLYARKPEKIANIVYANRMGNGDKSTGDGWKFRGRGYIQLTGRDNYTQFSKLMLEDFTLNPDLIATKYPLSSAAWFFQKNCLVKCDAGSTREVVESVTRCVNGGLTGIEDRVEKFNKIYKLLS